MDRLLFKWTKKSHLSLQNFKRRFYIFPRPDIRRFFKRMAFAETEMFSWGENDSLRVDNTIFYGKTTFEFPSLISKKTGVWETF